MDEGAVARFQGHSAIIPEADGLPHSGRGRGPCPRRRPRSSTSFPLTDLSNRVEWASMTRLTRWTLLVLSVAILMGHICVLPGHVHAETRAPHADTDQPHDSDEAVHAASCEAVRPASVGSSIAPVPSLGAVTATLVIQAQTWISSSRSPSLKSPPLFLLHSSLLI